MDRLEELPERIDKLTSEIVDIRVEMRGQFSIIHGRIDGLHGEVAGLRGEMHTLHAQALEHSDKHHSEAMAQTRMLYEDLIDRIKLGGVGGPPPNT